MSPYTAEKLFFVFLAVIFLALISRRNKEEQTYMDRSELSILNASRFISDHDGVFHVRVVAVEFDETGPVMFVNGAYHARDEGLHLDSVSAQVSINGKVEEFIAFEPCAEDGGMESRLGSLVNLTEPASICCYSKGLFRAPLYSPEREEAMADIMERLGSIAVAMVAKFDNELEDYSLEGHSLEKIEATYLRDRAVGDITEELLAQFIWRQGEVNIIMDFHDDEGENVESIPIEFHLGEKEFDSLHKNIENMILNALHNALEMPHEIYNSVVFEL